MSNGHVDISNSEVKLVSILNERIKHCQWSPSEDIFLSTCINGQSLIFIPSTDSGRLLSPDTIIRVTSLDWTYDGSIVATARENGPIILYTKNAEYIRTLNEHTANIIIIKFNPNGSLIAGSDQNGNFVIWKSSTGNIINVLSHPSMVAIIGIEWNTDFSFATAYNNDFSLLLFDVTPETPIKTFTGHENIVNDLKWNHEKKILATCSDDRTIKLWNLNQTICIHEFRIRSSRIVQLEWSSTGNLLASWSFDAIIQLWDMERNIHIRKILDDRTAIESFSFSPNGKLLACGTTDKSVKMFCTNTGQLLRQYIVLSTLIHVKWSPSGNQIVATTDVGNHYVLNVRTLIDDLID